MHESFALLAVEVERVVAERFIVVEQFLQPFRERLGVALVVEPVFHGLVCQRLGFLGKTLVEQLDGLLYPQAVKRQGIGRGDDRVGGHDEGVGGHFMP